MTAARLAVTLSMVTAWPVFAIAQRAQALGDSDLVVAAVPFRADTAAVRAQLGEPTSRKPTAWVYNGLVVHLDPRGKVSQVHLTSAKYATARGLRVGDGIDRVTRLYGPGCHLSTCAYYHAPDLDERGILVFLRRGHVTRIIVGAVFEV
jgi:hypothetical protein